MGCIDDAGVTEVNNEAGTWKGARCEGPVQHEISGKP